MRLFQIKNKEMYNGKDEKRNGTHIYAVYRDKKTKEYRAIQLTHIYDPKREKQLDNGILKVEKLKQFRYPTGVHNQYYTQDINGKALDFGRNTKHKIQEISQATKRRELKILPRKKLKDKRKSHRPLSMTKRNNFLKILILLYAKF